MHLPLLSSSESVSTTAAEKACGQYDSMDPITSTCHPTAESGARDSGGPIFELAEECKMLFTNYIAKLSDSEEHNGAKILLEIYQRFAASATSLGVFEKLHLSLKDTIRHNFDAKDQLLRLLDILQRNLTYCTESTC